MSAPYTQRLFASHHTPGVFTTEPVPTVTVLRSVAVFYSGIGGHELQVVDTLILATVFDDTEDIIAGGVWKYFDTRIVLTPGVEHTVELDPGVDVFLTGFLLHG